jgi:hypothetical protein
MSGMPVIPRSLLITSPKAAVQWLSETRSMAGQSITCHGRLGMARVLLFMIQWGFNRLGAGNWVIAAPTLQLSGMLASYIDLNPNLGNSYWTKLGAWTGVAYENPLVLYLATGIGAYGGNSRQGLSTIVIQSGNPGGAGSGPPNLSGISVYSQGDAAVLGVQNRPSWMRLWMCAQCDQLIVGHLCSDACLHQCQPDGLGRSECGLLRKGERYSPDVRLCRVRVSQFQTGAI